MTYLLSRLREPSSYAGAAGILAAFGLALDPGLAQDIVSVLTGLSGIAAFFLRERT